ncbi:MAG: hypothetical protein K2Y16_02035 [Burkholderiales bacterium]|nr:hypothetical protein [Burkholderiales bacterium]
MNAADVKALRNPLLALACVALIAAGTIYYSDFVLGQSLQTLSRQQQQLKDARTRLQRSGEEKNIIVQYLGGYQQLQRTGFVGEERRIDWLDGLRLTNQQAELFGVEYQIGVQQPYAYAVEINPAPLSLMQSVMKLRFRLLHEKDLLRFFDTLARQNVGVFLIDRCDVRRIDTGGVIRFQPNLQAECELSWITVKAGDAAEKKP